MAQRIRDVIVGGDDLSPVVGVRSKFLS